MKQIPLSQGYFALVDDTDYSLLMQRKWCVQVRKHSCYAQRCDWIDGKAHIVRMHRQVLGLSRSDGKMVDHIDGNGLNNQKNNLRLCTQSQNLQNCVKHRDGSSKYKGVSLDPKYNKWVAKIRHPNTTGSKHIGRFAKEIDAAKAYDGKAKELFGEFARLNLPENRS